MRLKASVTVLPADWVGGKGEAAARWLLHGPYELSYGPCTCSLISQVKEAMKWLVPPQGRA